MEQPAQPKLTTAVERSLAIGGAAYCLIATVMLWLGVSAYQGTWPLPGLYFIEIPALSVLGAALFVRGLPHGSSVLWGAAGATLAFSILGAFSVGLFYLPVALVFALISLTSDVRNKRRILAHAGIFFLAGVGQAILILTAINLL